MDKTAGALLKEFEEERTMTDNGLELQLRKMLKKSIKENAKLRKMLRNQILMHENIRTGIISLIKKVDNTIYPCEYNGALSDVIDLINKLELRKNEDEEQEENEE